MHKEWTTGQLDKVLWTDESMFKIFGSNRKVYVQWRVGERAATHCITLTIKHARGSVMVCGAFVNYKFDLLQFKGRLNQTGYHSIRQHHVMPTGMGLVSQGFLLMYEPNHANKLCQRYIKSKEEQLVFRVISWLSKSEDLNPVELVWEEPDRKVRAKKATSVVQLWHLLQESCEELSSVYFHSLVKRMPRICEAMMEAKWGHFDESKFKTCCGADKYVDPANELCEWEQPKQYEGTKAR